MGQKAVIVEVEVRVVTFETFEALDATTLATAKRGEISAVGAGPGDSVKDPAVGRGGDTGTALGL